MKKRREEYTKSIIIISKNTFDNVTDWCVIMILGNISELKHWLNLMQISDLISSMEKNWPSLSCPSSNGMRFWSHEWEKHGTCAQSELDQSEYFEAALKLKQKVNLLQILKNAGTHLFSFLIYVVWSHN